MSDASAGAPPDTPRDEGLHEAYYNPRAAGSYRGKYVFSRGRDRRAVADFLLSQDPYTLHFPLRRRFKRERVVVSGINDQFQADLLDVGNVHRENDGNKYILAVICVFSKYAWLLPLRDKTASSVIDAFQRVFAERLPLKLQTDAGTEFTNRKFHTFLHKHHVEHFITRSELKSSVVERFIRTMKNVLWRFFTANRTLRYIDSLSDLVSSYNETYHTAIGREPSAVNRENQEEVWQRLYGDDVRSQPTLATGTSVRISKVRPIFQKSALANYSDEIFVIEEALAGNPPTYRLRDGQGESIEGRFYREELQPVKEGFDRAYPVEAVLAVKGRGKKRRYLVKWKGYPTKFNSWVSGFV